MNTEGVRSKTIIFPSPAGMVPEETEETDETTDEPVLRPDNDLDAISPEELFGLPASEKAKTAIGIIRRIATNTGFL